MSTASREQRVRRHAAKFDVVMHKSRITGNYTLADARTTLIIQNPHCLEMSLEEVEAVVDHWAKTG